MHHCSNCSRRDFVKLTLGASAVAGLSSKFGIPFAAAAPRRAKAKACILLWMQGAQSQIDTWDPKPGTKTGGPFKAIETAAEGVRISEHLPLTARQMNKASIVRTLNSRDPNHDTATYYLHTGYRQASDVEHPHIGSVILHELGRTKTDLPGCIVIGGEPPVGASYLPPDRAPSVFDKLDNPTEDIVGEKQYFPKESLRRRWKLLTDFDKDWNKRHDDRRVELRRQTYERTYKLLRSSDLKAFELSKEPAATRKAYGDRPFGKAVLMARRLVQTGVRFVEVQLGSWDTHADNFNGHRRLLADLDVAYAALLADLARTGLLDETLVVLMGEFGRTPNINAANGRDHWTSCWSACLAGGGTAQGRAVGKTDPLGMSIASRPVSVQDLFATVYHCLGVDPSTKYKSTGGRPIRILDEGEVVEELLA